MAANSNTAGAGVVPYQPVDNHEEATATSSRAPRELTPAYKKQNSGTAGYADIKDTSSIPRTRKAIPVYKQFGGVGEGAGQNISPMLVQPPSKAGPARFDANVYVLMHSTVDYNNGVPVSSDFSRPIWVFTDSTRAERHMKDYAFQRSQARNVFLEDYEETEILDTRGARMGWGVQLTVRGPGAGPVQERQIAGKEILWLEQQCMDVENGIEGAGFKIFKTGI